MVETTDRRQTTDDDDVRERESGYTIDPDDISRCRQDQKPQDSRNITNRFN